MVLSAGGIQAADNGTKHSAWFLVDKPLSVRPR